MEGEDRASQLLTYEIREFVERGRPSKFHYTTTLWRVEDGEALRREEGKENGLPDWARPLADNEPLGKLGLRHFLARFQDEQEKWHLAFLRDEERGVLLEMSGRGVVLWDEGDHAFLEMIHLPGEAKGGVVAGDRLVAFGGKHLFLCDIRPPYQPADGENAPPVDASPSFLIEGLRGQKTRVNSVQVLYAPEGKYGITENMRHVFDAETNKEILELRQVEGLKRGLTRDMSFAVSPDGSLLRAVLQEREDYSFARHIFKKAPKKTGAFTIWDIASGKPDSQWAVEDLTELTMRRKINDDFELAFGWANTGRPVPQREGRDISQLTAWRKSGDDIEQALGRDNYQVMRHVYLLDARSGVVLRHFSPAENGELLRMEGGYYFLCRTDARHMDPNMVELWDVAREECVARLFSESEIGNIRLQSDADDRGDPAYMSLIWENPLPVLPIDSPSEAALRVPVTMRDCGQVLQLLKQEEEEDRKTDREIKAYNASIHK